MTYRSETEFGTLVGELLADLERFRPGLPQGAPLAEVQAVLAARARLRLHELYREYRGDESSDDPEAAAQLALYQREVDQILLPRYALTCQRQNDLERRPSAAWHGPALYNRLAYAAIFFLIGMLVVWAPFIPIWDKWVPFVGALLAPLGAPWLPDLYQRLIRNRHRIELGVLHQDLDRVGRSLPLPTVDLPALAAPRSGPNQSSAAR